MSVFFTHISHEICTNTRRENWKNPKLPKQYRKNTANEWNRKYNESKSVHSIVHFAIPLTVCTGKQTFHLNKNTSDSEHRFQQCIMCVWAEHITLTAKPAQIVPYLIVWGCWATLYYYYLVYICKHIMNKKKNERNEMKRAQRRAYWVRQFDWMSQPFSTREIYCYGNA